MWTDEDEFLRHTDGWSPERKRAFLTQLRTKAERKALVESVHHPAALAQSCDPQYVITPAVELVSNAVEHVLTHRGCNLLVTAPPQEFKSMLCAVWTPIRALQLHPEWRIMILTYADGLAEEHSATAKQMINSHGAGVVDPLTGAQVPDKLGISLRQDRSAVNRWRINEGGGGVVAAGLGSTITGKPADLIIIDDPYKNMQEADSHTIRQRVDTWYRSVARTRLAPGANVILIQTRWHPDDLAGTILKEERQKPPERRTWKYINIPAVSTEGIPDALGRPPGVAMESARGRTQDDFDQTRADVGERVWFALFGGSPAPPGGGMFSSAWFSDHRVTELGNTVLRVVTVDPAETGENDEAGVVAAAMTGRGQVVFTHDRSGHMTSDEWAKAAVDLAIETQAGEIAIETYTAQLTYPNVVRKEIAARRKQALAAGDMALYRYLGTLTVTGWRGTGDAVARSALLRQGLEVGTAAVLNYEMSAFELQATLWQSGQHQPDRVAAGVIAHDRLITLSGQKSSIGSPLKAIQKQQVDPRRAAWLGRKVG